MLNNKYYNKMELFLKLQDAQGKALKLARKIDKMDVEINILLIRYTASKSNQDLNQLAVECEKYLGLNLKYVYDSIPIYYVYKLKRDLYLSDEYKEFIKKLSVE